MKSSRSSLLGKSPKRTVSSWQPVELEMPNQTEPEVSVEEILDLFVGSTDGLRKNISGSGSRSVFSAEETADIESWMPENHYHVPDTGSHYQQKVDIPAVPHQNRQTQPERFSRVSDTSKTKSKIDLEDLKRNAEKEAEKILAEARAQAEEMVLQAQQESENIIAQAHEQLGEAMEKAHQMGLQEAEEETKTILQTVNTMLDQVSAWKEEVVTQSQEIVVDIIREISQTMFGSGLVLNEEALQQNLNRILDNAKNIGNLKLYLHPDDAGKLDPYWREFQASMTGSMVQIIPSDGITPGGCFIHGEMGSVDARVETQMRTIMETLQTDFSQTEEF